MGQVINATTPNCIEEIHHKCADEREVYINNIITHLYDLPLSERLVAFYYFFLFGIGICANVLVMSVLLLNAGSLRKPPGLYVFHLASADSLLLLSLPFVRDFKLYSFTNDGNV